MSDHYLGTLTAELAAHGTADYKVRRLGKHPCLLFEVQGREVRFVMAGSPSDRRAVLNARSELRKKLRRAVDSL